MVPLYKIAVVIHVLSAIIWIGGVLFMGAVAIPAAKKLSPKESSIIIGAVGLRFRPIGWVCLTLLVLTGGYMASAWGATWSNFFDLSFFQKGVQYRALGYKLIAVTLMIAVSGYHDWYLGPRSASLRTSADASEAARMRKLAGRLGRITGILVLIIAILAIFVARPWS